MIRRVVRNRRHPWRSAAAIVAATLLLGSSATVAMAADLRVLANVLSPAYLALNLTLVCSQHDASFLAQTRRLGGEVPNVVQHIKDEVIASLESQEAELVVRHAADAARSVALGLLRSMAGGSDAEEAARVSQWCDETAKPFVRGVVSGHETRHDHFERMLMEAKR